MSRNTIVKPEPHKVTAKGTHIFHFFKTTSDRALQLQDWIEEITRKREHLMKLKSKMDVSFELSQLSEKYQFCIEEMRRKFKVRETAVENITTTVGRIVFAKVLAGTYGSIGAVTHTGLGDNNTAAAEGQTTLINETSRKALSDGNTSSTTTLLETFFTTSEAVDTHEEYGFFIDGTAAADSGEMFNRFVAQNVKSNSETMNVQSSVAWNDA